MNEALPYWVNALVPLAYTLQDDRLKGDVNKVITKILHLIQPDGWIGPETIESGNRLIWARTLVFLGLTNLVEADPTTYQKPILDAMYRFNSLMNTMLKDNGTGMIYHEGDKPSADDYVWFRSRSQDMVVSLQWMLDHFPGNQSDILKENIGMIHQYSFKWEGWYTEQSYIKADLNTVPAGLADQEWPFLHGVTVAEALKYAAVIRRSTKNDSLITTAKNGVDWTFKYHGSASGTILADERLAGLNPFYGSELCTDVETIYSLAYNYFAIGDPNYADRAELAAFNALPAAMWPDWTSHQYMTEPNQPFAKNLSASPFWNVNTVGQSFGVEPNYPCCTVNHPQGFPKFTMYSYLKNGETGLVHALLSPGQVKTNIGGKDVTVDCQTDYPFDTMLFYTVNSETDFDFYFRVPEVVNRYQSQRCIFASRPKNQPQKDPSSLRKVNHQIRDWYGPPNRITGKRHNCSVPRPGPLQLVYLADHLKRPSQILRYAAGVSGWNLSTRDAGPYDDKRHGMECCY